MLCMTEETFGPTLPIMKVRDVEEGLRLANDSPYGLNSSVFTRDLGRGAEIAREIHAGNVCVNDALTNYFELRAPFAGWKQSGLGGRHGADGIRKYSKQQTVLVTRFAPRKDPLHYPTYPPHQQDPRDHTCAAVPPRSSALADALAQFFLLTSRDFVNHTGPNRPLGDHYFSSGSS